jgi:hypothetical protein
MKVLPILSFFGHVIGRISCTFFVTHKLSCLVSKANKNTEKFANRYNFFDLSRKKFAGMPVEFQTYRKLIFFNLFSF